MDKITKIEEIIEFVSSYPESTASRAILRRHYFNNFYQYESGKELSIQLRNRLLEDNFEEVNFCYYLIK